MQPPPIPGRSYPAPPPLPRMQPPPMGFGIPPPPPLAPPTLGSSFGVGAGDEGNGDDEYFDPSQLDDDTLAIPPPPGLPSYGAPPGIAPPGIAPPGIAPPPLMPPPVGPLPPGLASRMPGAPPMPMPGRVPAMAGAGAGAPAPAVRPLEELPVPKSWAECAGSRDLEALLEGDRQKDELLERRDAAETRKLRVLVCGTSTSNRAVWLAQFLGLQCARTPERDVMHARFKAGGVVHNLELAQADQAFAASEFLYRWADAFVLVYDVGSRDSFESVKDFYRGITEERGTVYMPIIVVANHAAGDPEDAWKIPRAEAVTLSDTLSIPLAVCATPAETHESMRVLLGEVLKKAQRRPEGAGSTFGKAQRKEITELEIVLLGDTFVGKTTFMNRVFDHKFEPAYVSTTAKVIRKGHVVVNGEDCMIKIVDTPWFPPSSQAVKGTSAMDTAHRFDVMNASAMATVDWLKQQQLLQAQCFIVLFSLTNRDSYILAQDLVSQLKEAFLSAPKSASKVIFLIGTKEDQANSCVLSSADLFRAAQSLQGQSDDTTLRLQVLSTTMSLRDSPPDVLQTVFERLLTGLRRRAPAASPAAALGADLERQGYLVPWKDGKKLKTKQLVTVRDSMLFLGHSEREYDSEGQYTINENSAVDLLKEGSSSRIHFVANDQAELWFTASNQHEIEAWVACLRLNIAVVQAAYRVTQSFVQHQLSRAVRSLLPATVPDDEVAAVCTLNPAPVFRQSFMNTAQPNAPKVSVKDAKKMEKEKRKAEKEREKAEKKKK